MKSRTLKTVIMLIVVGVYSCNDPKTVVTNIIHTDGSVTRKIEIRNTENNFAVSNIQVPFDNTWKIKDSIEVTDGGDTVWVKRAEKLFRNVAEINGEYRTDSSANREIGRHAEFTKRFRWFNTSYLFAEIIDMKMSEGYPVSDFLNKEELEFFYSPAIVTDAKLKGPDSLRYRALMDTISRKVDNWTVKNFILGWINEFSGLTAGKAGKDLSEETLRSKEVDMLKVFNKYEDKFDSLWSAGVIQKELIGEENAVTFRTEADSALKIATDRLFVSFKEYSLRIIMPGKLLGTNGYIDSNHILLWPVKSDFFLAEPYRMWAESKTQNTWAWIVTGLFLLFVASGLLIKLLRR